MRHEKREFAIRYNCMSSEINALYHELAVKTGVSDSVQSILYVVLAYGGQCLQSDVFRESGISRQTINSAIRRLEAEGIVTLEQGAGRNTVLTLTEKGEAFCEEKIVPVFQIEDHILGSWTEEERGIYLDLIRRFLATFREDMEKL